ncbi:MAG: GAF domain-containing protein [Armatimonadota bacterium]|nr:GAF domain-containing protein [Armatimonadota bacterium]MDW8155083.1 GAF domain-containing protein [Armatimonadota bacterium]
MLHRAAVTLTEPAPLGEVLQRILEQACALAEAPQGVVALYDPERGRLCVQAVTDALRPWVVPEIPLGVGLLGRVCQLDRPVVVEDYDGWEGRVPGFPTGVTGSAAALPLRYGGQVVGALAVAHRSGHRRWHPGQLQLLGYFADLAAVAVEAARQREVAQRRARELELLHRLHLVLDEQDSEQALLDAAVSAVQQTLGYDRVGVFLLEGSELVLRAHTVPADQRPVPRMLLQAGVNGRAGRTRAAQLVSDVTQDPDFLGSVQGVQSLVAVPLEDRGDLLGTLSVETLAPRRPSPEDARFLEEVGHVLAHALAQVRLQEAVRRNERWFRALVERSGEAVVVLDPQGYVRYVAPSVAAVLGYAPEEMLGRRAVSLVHPADLDWLRSGPGRVLEERGGELRAVVRARHRDGRWVELVACNLSADPDVAGVVVNFRDVTERWEAEQTARIRARQHAALAALGQLALEEDLDTLLQSATELVAQALSVELCKVLQVLPGGELAVLRAGVGWREDLVGTATVPLGMESQAGYTLLQGAPVVVDDLQHEGRFSGPALLRDHGVRSGMSVVIPGRASPWGVLGAHTRRKRRFSEDDVHFLEAAAALLGAAIRRHEDESNLRRQAAELEAVAELGVRLRGASSPEEVQTVLVDYAAAVTGSAHGAGVLAAPPDGRWTVVRAVGAYRGWEGERWEALCGQPVTGVGPWAEVELVAGGTHLGWLVVARRPEEPAYDDASVRVLRAVAELGASALSRACAFAELEQAYIDAVLSLARAVDARDAYTADHSERMARWAETVARRMGCSPSEVREVRWAALLHDIGKLGVPDAVLRKPGPLAPEEWEVVRRHPVLGEEILKPVRRLAGVAKLVRHHQERWDGNGYPDGLRGEQIPLGARILAVVDAYTAMTDHRPYRPARSHEEAVAELRRCAGAQFDPEVVRAFVEALQSEQTPSRSPSSPAEPIPGAQGSA